MEIHYCCQLFNDEYAYQSSTKIIKTLTADYHIKNNIIIRKYYKTYSFSAYLPFKAYERIIIKSLDTWIFEVRLKNNSTQTLQLNSVHLSFEQDKEQVVPINNKKDYKQVIMEPDEEINMIYLLNDPAKFNTSVILLINLLRNMLTLRFFGEECLTSFIKT